MSSERAFFTWERKDFSRAIALPYFDRIGRCPYDLRSLLRRGARAAEWAGLENRCGLRVTEGSNPSLSAFFPCKTRVSLYFFRGFVRAANAPDRSYFASTIYGDIWGMAGFGDDLTDVLEDEFFAGCASRRGFFGVIGVDIRQLFDRLADRRCISVGIRADRERNRRLSSRCLRRLG